MRVPREIALAAKNGEVDVVKAWLDAAPRDVNEICENVPLQHTFDDSDRTMTLLHYACATLANDGHSKVVQLLIERGADVSLAADMGPNPGYIWHERSYTALLLACGYSWGRASPDRGALLLSAGARTDPVTTNPTSFATPLSWAINTLFTRPDGINSWYRPDRGAAMETVRVLLRAGTPLESAWRNMIYSAEDHLRGKSPGSRDGDDYRQLYNECKELFAGVRAAGTYKAYVRAGHKELLRLRSLIVRGRAQVRGRSATRNSRSRADGALFDRVARLPNGAAWNVLSYWRVTN